MKTIISCLLAFFLVNVAIAQHSQADIITGTWLVQDGSAKVKIEKTNGKYTGKLVWIKAADKNTKPILDTKNPNPALRSRQQIGLMLLENFTFDGDDTWIDGTIYDPDSGKTYSCKITMKDNQNMEVRGYVGISLFGRTENWKRSQETTMR